jgi:hypothetical protein
VAKRELKELATTEPSLPTLKQDFLDAVQRRDRSVFSRQRLNYRARFCIWQNQSDDGKKWTAAAGQKPFPWLGASDARVGLVDKYINEDVSFLMVVSDRMRVMVSGTEANDSAYAHRLTNLLRWMKATQMTEYRRERRLAANYMLERGSAVIGVFWDRQEQLGYEEIDLETLKAVLDELTQRAQQGQPLAPEQEQMFLLPELLLNPKTEGEAAAVLGMLYPGVRQARLRVAVRELRTTGSTKLPRAYVVRDRPCVVALAPNEEVFLPPETTDIQTARGVFRREMLTESQLLEREHSHGWDREWITEVVNTQRGRMSLEFDANVIQSSQRVTSQGLLQTDKLFEVIHAYRRLHDEDGVPGIWYTCFSPGVMDAAAYHELLDYAHGQYPFVLIERENRTRMADDSRGYGEIAFTWQQQIKTQWDSRVDRASLATLPPSHYPPGMAPDKWGPGVQIPTMNAEEYGFLDIPKYDVGSQEVEESVRKFADEYFGRPVDEQNTVQSQVMRQELANNWMEGLKCVDTQILKLCQQFLPDEIYFRVVGSSQSKPLHATREEIQGEFDVQLGFNVGDLDNEVVAAKLGLIEKAMMMDTTGRVDRNAALDIVFELIDPDIGERILRPAPDASQSEIEDERNVIARSLLGMETDVKPNGGQAYDLRLKVQENEFQTNPLAMETFRSNPRVREVVEKRLKQLKFQVEQRENAVIGKLGA